MLKKIIITSKFAANIENPTAVPRKGALHGVANKVANAPDKNWFISPFDPKNLLILLFNELGKIISKKPKRLRLKRKIIKVIIKRKYVFWNWNPQPTVSPKSLKNITDKAKHKNEKKIPRII